MKHNGILFIILFGLTLAGCSLLQEPAQPVFPTPVATSRPLTSGSGAMGQQVTDPVSDIVPLIDPEITQLMDAVSQQQLIVYVQTLENFGTRSSFSDTEADNFGVGATRRWIKGEFERVGNGRLQVEFEDFTLSYSGINTLQRNIVATLPGTLPSTEEFVVIAHYDNRSVGMIDGTSRAPGANDNASGVALLLETARIMSARSWQHTIKFVAMASEEQGTYGSQHHAQNAFLDGHDILAVVNYDAVGGRLGIPQYARLFAPDYAFSRSGAVGRYYEYVGGLYSPGFPVVPINALDREGRWGDHREFVKIGIPAVRVIESVEDPELVNSLLDNWRLIDYTYLQRIVRLNIAYLANAAAVPLPPISLQVVPLEAGSFLLTWQTSLDVSGYAISFRPIDSLTYAPFRFVRMSDAGNVVLTGLDPNQTYMVSLAGLDGNGRLGFFSPEILVGE